MYLISGLLKVRQPLPVHELPRQAVRRAGCKACSISIHIEVDFLLVTFNPLSAPLTHSTPDPVMRDPNTALEKLTSLFSAECGILLVPVFASELPLSVSKNLSVLCSRGSSWDGNIFTQRHGFQEIWNTYFNEHAGGHPENLWGVYPWDEQRTECLGRTKDLAKPWGKWKELFYPLGVSGPKAGILQNGLWVDCFIGFLGPPFPLLVLFRQSPWTFLLFLHSVSPRVKSHQLRETAFLSYPCPLDPPLACPFQWRDMTLSNGSDWSESERESEELTWHPCQPDCLWI